jgi:hypothetical protein
MADTKESTKARSKAVTSPIITSRQGLNVPQNTPDGAKLPTAARAEKLRDLLARLKDVTHSWSLALDVTIPEPYISTNYIFFALPLNGHVIQNAVTSDGKQNFAVDGELVIPVTSEEK